MSSLTILLALLAGAPADQPAQTTYSETFVKLTGTRTITSSGRMIRSSAATYPVIEQDTGLGSRALSFGRPAELPQEGLQPLGETVTSFVTVVIGGPVDDGDAFGHEDWTRTTNADGSFSERGFHGGGAWYELSVGPDFRAARRERDENRMAFGMTSVPVGSDRIAVAMGLGLQPDPAAVPALGGGTYTTPRWFAQPVPTVVEATAARNAPLPAECAQAKSSKALFVHRRRRQIDPTHGVRETISDTYYDPALAALCRIESVTATTYETSTGQPTERYTERTVVARAS